MRVVCCVSSVYLLALGFMSLAAAQPCLRPQSPELVQCLYKQRAVSKYAKSVLFIVQPVVLVGVGRARDQLADLVVDVLSPLVLK